MTTTGPFQLYTGDDNARDVTMDDLGHLVVTVLDPDSGTIVTSRGVQGRDPGRIAVHPDGRRLYIPVRDGEAESAGLQVPDRPDIVSQVVVVDSLDLKMIATIDAPGRIDALSFSPDGSRLYVMCAEHFSLLTEEERADATRNWEEEKDKGVVTEIDTATSLPLRTFRNVSDRSRRWEIGRHGMALSTDGTRLYIGGFSPDHTEAGVRILDLATGELGDLTEFSGEGGGPDGFLLLAHPDGTRLYAAHRLAGTFAALDPDTLEVLARFEDHSGDEDLSDFTLTPTECQISPDGRHLYTAHDGRGSQILDAVTLARVGTLPEDFSSHQLSVTPDDRVAARTTREDQLSVLTDPHTPGAAPVVFDTDFPLKTVAAAAPTTYRTVIRNNGTNARFKHAASSYRQDGTKELLPHTEHAQGERLPDLGARVLEGHYARDDDGAWRPAPWPTGTNKTFLAAMAWSDIDPSYVFVYVDSDDLTWN